MNAPEPIPFKTEGPQPLLRETPQGAAYPVHALGPLQKAVEAVQGDLGPRRHTGAIGAGRGLPGRAGARRCGDFGGIFPVVALRPDHRGKRGAEILLRQAAYGRSARI